MTSILFFSSNEGLLGFEDVIFVVLVGNFGVHVTVFSPLLDNDELDEDDNEEDVEDGPRLLLTKD